MPRFAPNVDAVPGSGIRRIHEVALTLGDVIGLAVGEPDVAVAPHVLEAASAAWLADETRYTANGGIPELRAALVEKLARENDVHVDTEQVWVTPGATEALYLALSLVLSPGDEVLVPDPGYTTFRMGARILHADPVPYRLLPERDFLPDVEELEQIVTDRTRAIIVNSPSNPLGAVFDESVLRRLLEFAARHDLWLISDEVYEAFTYATGQRTNEHVSPAALDTGDRVLSVFSFSKTHALTGGRVGYLVTPPGVAETMRNFQEAIVSCVNTPAQRAALAALTGPQESVAHAREHYRANLEVVADLLDARGIRYLRPAGAFYLWVDMSHATGGDVASWAQRFLLEQRVAVAPGSAFGRSGEGWIRICLASSRENLIEGVGRLPAPASSRH